MHVKGEKFGEEMHYCRVNHSSIIFKVKECSTFDDKSQPAIYDMYQIAWKFASDKAGRPIGFVNPRKFKELKKEGRAVSTPEDDDNDY